MATDDDGFKASFGCYGGEEAGIAFADSEAGGEGGSWGGWFDGVIEEGNDVVGYIVMKPGEDCSGFICQRSERIRQLVRQPINRRNGLIREFGSMGVWA